jgi:Glycosyl transferase family 2
MRLVMTLLARDEADVVDAQVAFHLHAGVDHVIATDNRSEDGTTEILEGYEREGVLTLIREPGDDLRQSEWVTRMAQLAATEHRADWVLNADADEFWWPQGDGLKDVLEAVPERYGVVRAAWRNFVPRPMSAEFFAERMTVRLCTPAFHHHPLSTHSKSAHRATPDVRIGRGNHEAFGEGLLPLRGWYPFEILHFPVRSLEQCVRKYVTQFAALERNAEKGIPNHMAAAYEAWRVGRLEEFYEPLVVGDDELERGLASGRFAYDTRLRDVLQILGFGHGSEGRSPEAVSDTFSAASRNHAGSRIPGVRHWGFAFGRLDVSEAAQYAAESSALDESDLFLSLGARIDDLESRLGRVESGSLSRIRGAVRRRVLS